MYNVYVYICMHRERDKGKDRERKWKRERERDGVRRKEEGVNWKRGMKCTCAVHTCRQRDRAR